MIWLAFADFKNETDLQKLHNVTFKSCVYENESMHGDFIHDIHQQLSFWKKRNFYQKDKKKAKFILILCDGSTNSSVVDQEVVYTKYTDAETFKPYL